jgi:uncharacterized membrane protein
MVTAVRWLPVALLTLGTALVVHSVVTGSTRLYLLVVLPVLSGASWEFGGGVLLLMAGFFTMPFAFSSTETGGPDEGHRSGSTKTTEPGGVLLLGPVPLFFGSWRGAGRGAYLVAVAVGAVLFAALVLLLFFF